MAPDASNTVASATRTHADDEYTYEQLVAHASTLFGLPSWAVEAALIYEGQVKTQSIESAQDAVNKFMARVAAP